MIYTDKICRPEDGTNKYKGNIEICNNTDEILNDLKSRHITDKRFDNQSTAHFNANWHGVSDYQEALSLLHNGYQPAVDIIRKEIKIKTAKRTNGSQKRFSYVNSVEGFQPIVPLAIQGIPNSMVNQSINRLKSKIIDIYYDVVCSCFVNPDDIINAGVTLLSNIVNLEAQGYRINLFSVQMYCDRGSADILCVKIKNSNLPIDIKRMSFPLVHPAFFRVLGFDWYSKFPPGKFREGYGEAFYYQFDEEKVQEIFRQFLGKNAIYISSMALVKEGEKYIQRALLRK